MALDPVTAKLIAKGAPNLLFGAFLSKYYISIKIF